MILGGPFQPKLSYKCVSARMFRRIRNQWRYRVTVLYMCGSSLSPSSFAITPILPFFHLYSCNLTKHKTLETWNKHVLQLKEADQKNIVLFIFGWLEFPIKKIKYYNFSSDFIPTGNKSFLEQNFWTFECSEFRSILFQCWNTLVQHLDLMWKKLMV